MHFNEYQELSKKTALYPDQGKNIIYPTLGLCSETGEIANKVKKIFRDDGGKITEEKRKELRGEVGDVLWYIAQFCTEFGYSLEDIAQENLIKLNGRMERGTLHGSGDNR